MVGPSFLVGNVDEEDGTVEPAFAASGAMCKSRPTVMGWSV
jgi:hypothetical protein